MPQRSVTKQRRMLRYNNDRHVLKKWNTPNVPCSKLSIINLNSLTTRYSADLQTCGDYLLRLMVSDTWLTMPGDKGLTEVVVDTEELPNIEFGEESQVEPCRMNSGEG
jgi:hypothetical protein